MKRKIVILPTRENSRIACLVREVTQEEAYAMTEKAYTDERLIRAFIRRAGIVR